MEEQLKQYIFETKSSDYAILVTGPWGCGKTFFIKNFIKENLGEYRRNKMNRYDPIPNAYVSLNGKSTIDQLRIDILATIDPGQFKTAKGAEFLLSAALAQAKIRQGINLVGKLKFSSKTILFLDDLERWGGSISEIMGFVNRLVEHERLKVILIADQDILIRLTEKQDTETDNRNDSFTLIKEKTIGKTLKFKQDETTLFSQFIGALKNENCREYLSSRQIDLIDIFRKSNVQSFRVLKRSIEDFQVFWTKLDTDQLIIGTEFDSFTSQYFMFQFEFKKGNFTNSDLESYNQYRRSLQNQEEQKIDQLSNKYKPDLSFHFYLARKEFWLNEILGNGATKDQISTVMKKNGCYPNGQKSDWVQLWYYWRLTSVEFRSLIERIEISLARNDYLVAGEILHIFLLLNSLDEQGIIIFPDALQSGRNYIDTLFDNNDLEEWNFEKDSMLDWDSHESLGFADRGSQQTKDFVAYMANKLKENTLNNLQHHGLELIEQLRNQTIVFCRRMRPSNESDSLHQTPILANTDSSDFCDVFLSLHPEEQTKVLTSINSRYSNQKGRLQPLIQERDFLESIDRELRSRLEQMDTLDVIRLTARLDKYIVKSVELLNEAITAQNN